MRIVLAVMAVLALSACGLRSTCGGGGYAAPGLNLKVGQVLIGRIPDGSGEDGVVVGSGDLMTQKVRQFLLVRGVHLVPSDKTSPEELLSEAAKQGVPYVLTGTIPKWEDNSTWGGNLDFTSVALEVYRVTDKTLVASSERELQGVTVPEDWAQWVAYAAVSDLLGELVLSPWK